MTHCHICQKQLTGGLDTFGDVGFPVCQECWLCASDEMATDNYAGLVNCATCRNAAHHRANHGRYPTDIDISEMEANA